MDAILDFEAMSSYDKLNKIYFFISVRTAGEKELWGRINDNEMSLSVYGKCALDKIKMFDSVHDAIRIERSVVMPNHVHFLLAMDKSGFEYTPTEEELLDFIGDMIEKYKKSVSSSILKFLAENQSLGIPRDPSKEFWHSGCHIRGIHNLYDYKKAVAHIANNVREWKSDRYYKLTVY